MSRVFSCPFKASVVVGSGLVVIFLFMTLTTKNERKQNVSEADHSHEPLLPGSPNKASRGASCPPINSTSYLSSIPNAFRYHQEIDGKWLFENEGKNPCGFQLLEGQTLLRQFKNVSLLMLGDSTVGNIMHSMVATACNPGHFGDCGPHIGEFGDSLNLSVRDRDAMRNSSCPHIFYCGDEDLRCRKEGLQCRDVTFPGLTAAQRWKSREERKNARFAGILPPAAQRIIRGLRFTMFYTTCNAQDSPARILRYFTDSLLSTQQILDSLGGRLDGLLFGGTLHCHLRKVKQMERKGPKGSAPSYRMTEDAYHLKKFHSSLLNVLPPFLARYKRANGKSIPVFYIEQTDCDAPECTWQTTFNNKFVQRLTAMGVFIIPQKFILNNPTLVRLWRTQYRDSFMKYSSVNELKGRDIRLLGPCSLGDGVHPHIACNEQLAQAVINAIREHVT